MSKVTLDDITAGYSVLTKFNSNNQKIEDGFDNTLSRDGSGPNTMEADLDLNSHRVINLAAPTNNTDAARWVDVTDPLSIAAAPSAVGQGDKVLASNGTNALWLAPELIKLFPRTATEIAQSVTPTAYQYEPGNVLRYGATGNGVTDDTTAIQNAVKAMNGGEVYFPDGTYMITRIGVQGTWLRGQSREKTILKRTTNAGSATFMVDQNTNRDGTTANTVGRGGITNMTINGDNKTNVYGVSTYGGGVMMSNVEILGCVDGLWIGLPIWSNYDSLYIHNNSGRGLRTYSGAGDIATSLHCSAIWCDANGTRNFHIEQLTYSTFTSCVSQAIPATGIGWYVEGGTNGTGVGSSLTFNACASEGDLGEPFYFKFQRGLTIISPKIVQPPSNKHLITLDNASGAVIAYQAPTPGGGFQALKIINHGDSNGAIATVGGDFAIDAGEVVYLTTHGTNVNGVRRRTGWGAPSGTAERTTYATYTSPTIGGTYSQTDVQGIATATQNVSRRLKALIDDLTAVGIIGA